MYHAQYINGEKTVNFPLTAEKVTNFSRLDGMQLLGVLDGQGKLCGFACFFVKQWPDFAGDLNSVADRFVNHSDKKAYLYLVLVRPEAKGDGAFEAMYDQVEKTAVEAGNVGCAIEIHQLNTQSVIAHKRIGFQYMGTTAVHEREDVTGEKFPLVYRQYYRSYSNSPDGISHTDFAAPSI
jgi:L-amino acid N-acyltransferase YncA